jgi:hypothetical protein
MAGVKEARSIIALRNAVNAVERPNTASGIIRK